MADKNLNLNPDNGDNENDEEEKNEMKQKLSGLKKQLEESEAKENEKEEKDIEQDEEKPYHNHVEKDDDVEEEDNRDDTEYETYDLAEDEEYQDEEFDDEEEKNKNYKRGEDKMSKEKTKYVSKTKEPKSPQEGGINMGAVKEYGDPIMTVTNLTYDAISEFILDSIQEIQPVKVDWKVISPDELKRTINADSAQARDTISKITGAKLHQDGGWIGGFDAVPVPVFEKCDVVREIDYRDNLGAVSRKMWELDFNKLKHKNRKYFPKYGMVTSYDEVNNLVQVNVNIINILISALGFSPEEFGSPDRKNKLFLYPKQEPQQKQFKVTIVKNKYYSDRLMSAISNM